MTRPHTASPGTGEHGGHAHHHGRADAQGHAHGHEHAHGHASTAHPPTAAPTPGRSLLMASSAQRLLLALALIALLWLAVAWAVLSSD